MSALSALWRSATTVCLLLHLLLSPVVLATGQRPPDGRAGVYRDAAGLHITAGINNTTSSNNNNNNTNNNNSESVFIDTAGGGRVYVNGHDVEEALDDVAWLKQHVLAILNTTTSTTIADTTTATASAAITDTTTATTSAAITDTTATTTATTTTVHRVQQAKLTASDATIYDYFGISVAISGDTAVVGAEGDDDGGALSGSAYVFVRSGSSWTQQAKLTASDPAANGRFGYSVAISGDTAVVGAHLHDNGGIDSGSAYVFVRSGSSWTQQAKLAASDAATADYFGWSVAISGGTAVVGAKFDDDGGSYSGSAYVFERSGSTWTQQAKLTASDADVDDYFGTSVAIFGDTAVVGAKADDDGGFETGSAYVFERSGSTWAQQAKLTASDADVNDYFGTSVAIFGDTAVVGAEGNDDGGSGSGSAYVFVRSGSTWTQQAKLTASDAAADDRFGTSVSIFGDTAVVGAEVDDDGGVNSGSAYVFVRSGSSWTQQTKLTASDATASDWFGTSVAISEDTAVVGAYHKDDAGDNSGSAYVFVV